jgi:hypothetical protein
LTEIALVKAAVARMESYYLTKSGDIDGASKTLTASSFELEGLSETLFIMGAEKAAKSVKIESATLRKDDEDVTKFKVSVDKNLLYKARNLLRKKGDQKPKINQQIDEDPGIQES